MNYTEAEKFWREVKLKTRFMKNYIDYENIENPIQSIDAAKTEMNINVGYKQKTYIEYQTHIFEDNTKRAHVFGFDT